ncbi:MAG: LON peptidase substrate-binding domain-containing protein, partial [Pseudomonadota bacterium]
MAEDGIRKDDFPDDDPTRGQQIDLNDIPDVLPLLPVRDVVIYSYMILPLMVGREKSIAAVEAAMQKDRLIFLVSQKSSSQEDPAEEDIFDVGTVAMIVKMLKLPDGRVKILVQGLAKARIVSYEVDTDFFRVRIEKMAELAGTMSIEVEALMRSVKENSEKILQLRGVMSPDAVAILDSIEDPGRLADLVASNLKLKVEESQTIL